MSAEQVRTLPNRRHSREEPDSAAAIFLAWARDSHVPLPTAPRCIGFQDLAPLGRMIGNASLVALSEAMHYCAEPLEFRNRLLEYLVVEKGFTAIAIESGIVESQVVHDYVAGGHGDLPGVLTRGIGWTFDRLPQNRALVQWMREYNARPQTERKVKFYGFDVPGSAGNPDAARGVDTAIRELLDFLRRVDSAAAGSFGLRLAPLLGNLQFNPRAIEQAASYLHMSRSDRDSLTATIAELVVLMECSEARYVAASTRNDYEWAHRAAIGARQVDSWLRRRLPADLCNHSAPQAMNGEPLRAALRAEETRDRAQADNLEWIVRQEGRHGKVLIFAHRYHLSTAPVIRNLPNEGVETKHEVAGTYLRRRFGKRLVTIGNLIGQGEAGPAGSGQRLQRAARESIDGFVAGVGAACFLLDLRAAPAASRRWLNRERSREHSNALRKHSFKLRVGKAFDVLLYMDVVTPVCDMADSGCK
jgi:erythromycin esterase